MKNIFNINSKWFVNETIRKTACRVENYFRLENYIELKTHVENSSENSCGKLMWKILEDILYFLKTDFPLKIAQCLTKQFQSSLKLLSNPSKIFPNPPLRTTLKSQEQENHSPFYSSIIVMKKSDFLLCKLALKSELIHVRFQPHEGLNQAGSGTSGP